MNLFDQIDAARTWSSEEQEVISQVKRLVGEIIAPNAPGVDRSGEFPRANVEAINRLGLNGLYIPEVYGGVPMRFKLHLEVFVIRPAVSNDLAHVARLAHANLRMITDFGLGADGKRVNQGR